MEVAGVQELLFDVETCEVARFQHGGDHRAGLLRHHGLPTGRVDGEQTREAVEAGGRGANNPRRRGAGGGGGGRGAQGGDQELVREAVLKAAAFAGERGSLKGEHVFVPRCGRLYGVEDNLRRGAVAAVPVGQDSGERDRLQRARGRQDHGEGCRSAERPGCARGRDEFEILRRLRLYNQIFSLQIMLSWNPAEEVTQRTAMMLNTNTNTSVSITNTVVSTAAEIIILSHPNKCKKKKKL